MSSRVFEPMKRGISFEEAFAPAFEDFVDEFARFKNYVPRRRLCECDRRGLWGNDHFFDHDDDDFSSRFPSRLRHNFSREDTSKTAKDSSTKVEKETSEKPKEENIEKTSENLIKKESTVKTEKESSQEQGNAVRVDGPICGGHPKCCLHGEIKKWKKAEDKFKSSQFENKNWLSNLEQKFSNPVYEGIFESFFKPRVATLQQQKQETHAEGKQQQQQQQQKQQQQQQQQLQTEQQKGQKVTNIKIQNEGDAQIDQTKTETKNNTEAANVEAIEVCSKNVSNTTQSSETCRDNASLIATTDSTGETRLQKYEPWSLNFNIAQLDPKTVRVHFNDGVVRVTGRLEEETVEDGWTKYRSGSAVYERTIPPSVDSENLIATLTPEGKLTVQTKEVEKEEDRPSVVTVTSP